MSDEPRRTEPTGMFIAQAREKLREEARNLLVKLDRGDDVPEPVGKQIASTLRASREFSLLSKVTEALRHGGNSDPKMRLWQAQGLIEQGELPRALDLLQSMGPPAKDADTWSEVYGLMGRAWKQAFFSSPDKGGKKASEALAKSIEQYGKLPDNPWHGVNLLALSTYAREHSLQVAADIDRPRLATKILSTLDALPQDKRDNWYFASRAEAMLALGNLDQVEKDIGAYVRDSNTTAFALGGTLRQFKELWQLDGKGQRERGIVQALSAALLKKEGGQIELAPDQYQRAFGDKPPESQLEAILGDEGPVTFDWWLLGGKVARAVCAVYKKQIRRIGTGFLCRGRALKAEWGEELVVLTNAHVVSNDARDEGIPPDQAAVRFEVVDKNKTYEVDSILWISHRAALDASVLRLKEPILGIEPLDHAPALPLLDGKQRVYVIGHPQGGDLKISFQDNTLIDHEGPSAGKPVDPAIRRVHYLAPTEKGNSGSPVFNADWEVIALHHAGSKEMPRLNGIDDAWPANEGIWIKSILDAPKP